MATVVKKEASMGTQSTNTKKEQTFFQSDQKPTIIPDRNKREDYYLWKKNTESLFCL